MSVFYRDIHFYDRRPSHNNAKLKTGTNVPVTNVPVTNVPVDQTASHTVEPVQAEVQQAPEEVSHLSVLQALEAIGLQPDHPQIIHHHTPITARPQQTMQQTPHQQQIVQIISEAVPAQPSMQ